MKHLKLITMLLIVLALLLNACTPASDSPAMDVQPDTAANEEPAEADKEEGSSPAAVVVESSEPAINETPEWYSAVLTNVNTGEAFTINDFKGRVVLVETMAQWCSNCKRQQRELKDMLERLGARDDFVAVVLDIDPNESAETLKAYAADNGFDWVYAVAPAEVSRELSNLYGANFVNPPSTPILIIDRTGEAHPLRFGIKNADELMESIQPYLENM